MNDQAVIRFKREHPRATLPTKLRGNAAYDLVFPEEVTLEPGVPTLVDLGFSTEFPDHLWANIKPRSSTYPKKRIRVQEGVIDSHFRGNWKLSLVWEPGPPSSPDSGGVHLRLPAGERLAQVVFMQLPETVWEEIQEDLSETERGSRGFGESTGL